MFTQQKYKNKGRISEIKKSILPVRKYHFKRSTGNHFQKGFYHNEFLTYSLQTNAAAAKKSESESILEQLTDREKEFLKLVCHEEEYTYEQIADKMKIRSRSVENYREAIFEKFGIKSKTGLVLFVLKHRLFDLL